MSRWMALLGAVVVGVVGTPVALAFVLPSYQVFLIWPMAAPARTARAGDRRPACGDDLQRPLVWQ